MRILEENVSPRAVRILLADDLAFIGMVRKEVLTEHGYEIVGEATNGREAAGRQNLIVQAINAGLKDFIVKPFNPERLLSAIAKAMEE